MSVDRPAALPDRVLLWAGGDDDLEGATDPPRLAAVHPAWRRAMEALAPWRPFETAGGLRWWGAEGGAPAAPVVICERCGSTQDAGRLLAGRALLGAGGSVLAAIQSAGRGRMGRLWASPPGNLYATWIWPAAPEAAGRAAPLALGLTVARILEGLGFAAIIKWPNDLLVTGRKVAGILTETAGSWTFAGVGANLHASPSEKILRIEGSLPATNLAVEGVRQDPVGFWLAILRERGERPWILPEDPKVLSEEIEARLAWRGERISVRDPSEGPEAFDAVLLGLDADGSLRVRRGTRVLVLSSARIQRVAP